MSSQQVENVEEVKRKEKDSLLEVCGGLAEVKLALRRGDFGSAQGALTGVFNFLGGFIYYSQYLNQEKKNKLIALNEFIFDSRARLVNQIEVVGQDLETVVSTGHFYKRLDFINQVLNKYINEWYQS